MVQPPPDLRKAKFLTSLDLRLLNDTSADGRGTWQLLAPLAFYSALLQATITVPAGFVTDFASVPRWIPVLSTWLQDRAHQAAVVHDWLYSSHEIPRERADAVLREAGIACGMSSLQMWLYYQGVRLGGSGPWDADGQDQPPRVLAVLDTQAITPG
ncbi:MAG: hypothetical protein JWQ72_2361 [Polaromonas sp.]|nr:hypothetical protein [Polaromonas sp.]